MRLADELAFESSRDPGVRTIRVLKSTLRDDDQIAAISAVHGLALISDEEAARSLAGLLSSERLFLREHAAWVLGTRLPRADSTARLISMIAGGGFGGMLAQRSLEQWSSGAPEQIAVGLESALLGVDEPGARARLVETLGLVRHVITIRPLVSIAGDRGESEEVRIAAIAALGQRRGDTGVASVLIDLAMGSDILADVARLSLIDLDAALPVSDEIRDGLTVGQLFLHADIDADLTSAGAGDNGGIATLLVRLGDALVAPGRQVATPVSRVITMSRGSVTQAAADLDALGAAGHLYGRVPLLRDPVPSAAAWPLRVAARRGIRRVLRAAGGVDMLHLRMADVGSLAAADVARELDIPVIFTVAPDPHAVIQSLDLAGRLTRENFGDVDESEHFWFRVRLVQQLAANAAHTVLFPRPSLRRDMRQLVGIDITARPERHTIVPEGVDLQVIDSAVAEATAHMAGEAPSDAVRELRGLVEELPIERRGLPLIVSVGRLHRVKGMASLVSAWAQSGLHERANLLIVGGDLADPSDDEREQLDLIDTVVPADQRAQAGLLLPGHRRNDVVARWVAAARTGLPGLTAPGGIYVCASLKEEFGIALLEAMASGLLVVAPDGGGPATYVVEGVTGYLTATWDTARLSEAMVSALDASLAETDRRRADRSHRTVEKSFTIQRMAEKLVDVYAGVADEELGVASMVAGR
ncbi:sucrose synthase (sucrose-UDP glucosyltransferase) [Amnibacterium flavum]|uniref:D-inositol 3-phosphate glycosyltransferase n=2 Tax=Amnibacterium flavum TaxID=2173173 RepID=A0A2V1HM47_9MICO|nr:sucrose synthase (sucrose-UDP glucosyltransferase) [Amnibacterium flavum]